MLAGMQSGQGQAQAQSPQVIGTWDNLPFRVMPGEGRPTLRQDDPEYRQPTLVQDAKIKVFDLSKPDDLEEYQSVCDMVAKGKAVVSMEHPHFCADTQNWRVLLRWLVLAYQMGQARVAHFAGTTIYLGADNGTA